MSYQKLAGFAAAAYLLSGTAIDAQQAPTFERWKHVGQYVKANSIRTHKLGSRTYFSHNGLFGGRGGSGIH